LLPLVEDTGWFFDTELLVLAQRAGLRIHEVPVDWVDDPDSRVDLVATALEDLRGIARLARAFASGAPPVADLRREIGRQPLAAQIPGVPSGLVRQLARFAAIGVLSTLAYTLLYVLARQAVSAQTANLLALLVTAIGNTAANRRVTFGVTGPARLAQHHMQGLVVFGLGLALTSGTLALPSMTAPEATHAIEVFVLAVANLVATLCRFLLFRVWVFGERPSMVQS
jgi:putative flippase GtrA